MTDTTPHAATTPAIERIARVLAGQRLSANAEGSEPSAADAVDQAWQDYREDAVAVLKTLREPDAAMAGAGDPAVWHRMVEAALGIGAGRSQDYEPAELGTEPFYEGP